MVTRSAFVASKTILLVNSAKSAMLFGILFSKFDSQTRLHHVDCSRSLSPSPPPKLLRCRRLRLLRRSLAQLAPPTKIVVVRNHGRPCFFSISGVSKIATRLTAARYGVKLSPSFLVPSNWTGCLGVMNNYDSLLPNKKELFDIPVARTASAYLTSLALAIAAFVVDGSFNGGDNALCIRLQFFYNNPLLSFIQFVIRPYTDDLGNVLPYAVEGVGVPVDPLAFAGLLVFPEVAEQIYAITGANIAIGAPDQSLPPKLLDKLAEPKKCSITLKAYMYNYTGIAQYKFNVNFITNEPAPQALASPSATPNKKEKLHATSPSKQATKQSSGKKPKLN